MVICARCNTPIGGAWENHQCPVEAKTDEDRDALREMVKALAGLSDIILDHDRALNQNHEAKGRLVDESILRAAHILMKDREGEIAVEFQ